MGRGDRCYCRGADDGHLFKPDWSLCSNSHLLNERLFHNLLPGDTKLSIKWRSSMRGTDAHYPWKDPVRQILYYMDGLRVCYGWLITDAELVVLRASAQLTGLGQAVDQPRRAESHGSHRVSQCQILPHSGSPSLISVGIQLSLRNVLIDDGEATIIAIQTLLCPMQLRYLCAISG